MTYSAATCVLSSKEVTATHQLLEIAHLVPLPPLHGTSKDPRTFRRIPGGTSPIFRKSTTREIVAKVSKLLRVGKVRYE